METKSRKERPLTVFNVLVDSVDLIFNFRGLGWAWSSEPFYEDPNPAKTIPHQCFKLLIKIASLDAAHYVVQLIRPTAYRPEGDTIYDYTLDPLPHFLQILTISVCAWSSSTPPSTSCTRFARWSARSYSASPSSSGPYREPSLVGHVCERVLGEALASVLPPSLRRIWLASRKKGHRLVPLVEADLHVRSHLCCMYALLF